MAAAALLGGTSMAGEGSVHSVDHIGIGCADILNGIELVATRTGVKPEIGGVHPGRGTHNALASLGDGVYLEIVAPLPGVTPPEPNTDLVKLATPRPVFFAVRSNDIERTAKLLRDSGYAISEIRAGSRNKPDGSVLEWRTFGITDKTLESAPFFIEWSKASAHPSATSPKGCKLAKLVVEDKDPAKLEKLFKVLGLDVTAAQAPSVGFRVTMSCPKGEVAFGP